MPKDWSAPFIRALQIWRAPELAASTVPALQRTPCCCTAEDPERREKERLRLTACRNAGRASVGADVFAGEAATLRLYYDGAFGSTTTSQIFGSKLSIKF